MITYTEFMGEPAVLLENEKLRAVILPKKGGKAASLFCKETGMELLYQNKKNGYGKAEFGSDFSQFEASGFDDAFPNVDAEQVEIGERMLTYPDHGEIWSASFEAKQEGEKIKLFYYSQRMNYEYQKSFWLEENRLCCAYEIKNCGIHSLPCLWTMHCLVPLTPKMHLVFPEGTDYVQNVFTCETLGEEEQIYPYPQAEINGNPYYFDQLPKEGMVKYYVRGKVRSDGCGYDYPETGTSVRIFYDPKKLPYLGCWITAGGYRGEYNCALEPSSGYYDSVGKARKLGEGCPILAPGETFTFEIAIWASALKNC